MLIDRVCTGECNYSTHLALQYMNAAIAQATELIHAEELCQIQQQQSLPLLSAWRLGMVMPHNGCLSTGPFGDLTERLVLGMVSSSQYALCIVLCQCCCQPLQVTPGGPACR